MRWNRRMLFGALAVLVPALAGCEAGLNAPTLEYHPAAFGGYAAQDGISIDNAFVLGSSTGVAVPRAGVFFSVVSQDGDRLVSINAPGTAPLVRIAGGAVNLPPGLPVDLTGPEPKVVLTGLSSPLAAGSTITMDFNFARVGTVTMSVPVEPHAYEYATYSPPPSIPTGKPTPGSTASASPAPSPSGSIRGATASATPAGGASASPSP
jgi:copper(I)-binding protein